MGWLPWILLFALALFFIWCLSEIVRCVRWARQALLRTDSTARPQSWLICRLQIDDLFSVIENRAGTEDQIKAAAERRIGALLAPLNEAVLVVDTQDRLRLANPASVKLFSLDASDLGNSIVPLVRSADFIDLIQRVRQEGSASATLLLNRAPLSDIWVQATGARTDPEAFGEGAAIFVLTDVTALKRLQAMERDFVTNVSHDLRTPVTILRGYAETLADDHNTMAPSDRERFIQKIVNSVSRLQGLVEGLLALASLETSRNVKVEAGALHQAIHEVTEEFAARSKAAGMQIILELKADERAAADPVQARRLTQNLIENALAHATDATQLLIRTVNVPNGVTLSVEDNGPGVAAADLPRLFDRFYRTDKSRRAGGSGLGLSIVRQVAELHGGSAGAEPVKPHGLRVFVTLPKLNSQNP
jgi:signal transduction histidine kinase